MKSVILTFVFAQIYLISFGQAYQMTESYKEFKSGIYQLKSTDSKLIGLNPKAILPQQIVDPNVHNAFIKIEDQVVALFSKINDDGKSKPIGVLRRSSAVEVDTTFYLEAFRDPNNEWNFTHNVWSAITINGEKYYTDYKLHDHICYRNKLNVFDQELLIISQGSGYDGYYNLGYPDKFFVVVLDRSGKVIFESGVLDYDYENEFWEEEYQVKTEFTPEGFAFTIRGLRNDYSAVWTGESLIKEEVIARDVDF